MPKILIVEDNEENRDSLSRRLQRRGFAVVLAENGKVGVASALSEKPDLILMDMNLPELDGWEATRQLRKVESMRSVPIIAVTAHDMAEDREKSLAAGCDDHHPKPVDLTRLLAQIEALLKKAP